MSETEQDDDDDGCFLLLGSGGGWWNIINLCVDVTRFSSEWFSHLSFSQTTQVHREWFWKILREVKVSSNKKKTRKIKFNH